MVLDVSIRFNLNIARIGSKMLEISDSVIVEAEKRSLHFEELMNNYRSSVHNTTDDKIVKGTNLIIPH